MVKNSILFVHANNYDVGGADYCLYKMVKEVQNSQYRPIVLLSKYTSIVDLYKKNNITVYVKPILRLQKTQNIFKYLGYLYRIPLTIAIIIFFARKENCKIIHSNDLLDFLGSVSGKLLGIHTVQHVRMILTPGIMTSIITWIVEKMNDVILCVSKGVKKHMFLNTPHAETLYDWIDPVSVGHDSWASEIKIELGLNPESNIVCCVGRLEPWKGQILFVEAAKKLLKDFPNYYFLIVGGTVVGKQWYYKYLEDKINEGGLKKKVLLIGERKDILSIFKQSYLAVHTSITPDPFPGVILEALYCGIPVIGPNEGGVPEEIQDGITGLLYKMGDHEDLVKKMAQVMSDELQKNEMAKKAKYDVVNRFSVVTILPQLLNTYKRLLHEK